MAAHTFLTVLRADFSAWWTPDDHADIARVSDKICAPMSEVLLRGKETEGSWWGQGTADHSCSSAGNPAPAFPPGQRNSKGENVSSLPDRPIEYCYTTFHNTLPQSKLGKNNHLCMWYATQTWPDEHCGRFGLTEHKVQPQATMLWSMWPQYHPASLTPSHFQLCKPWKLRLHGYCRLC